MQRQRKGSDYVIFPLDVSLLDEAKHYIKLVKDHVGIFKVGLELFVRQGPSILQAITDESASKIFLDMKFHDIPATVKGAYQAASEHKAKFITVHCDEGKGLLKAVVDGVQNGAQILGVTVLTSLSKQDLKELGYEQKYQDPKELVLLRARIAAEAGCDGVVCSGWEAKEVKKTIGEDFIVVVPGMRPRWSLVDNDDQKRIMTPREAILNGADYIVVGRPIRNHSNPADAARRVADEVEEALEEKK